MAESVFFGKLTCFRLCRNWDARDGKCSIFDSENPTNFENPRDCIEFKPYIDGDRILRDCGAVGHGCEECYIKCGANPMTQEEDDLDAMYEWELEHGDDFDEPW